MLEIATYKHDFWGREVIRGVSWDLLWLVLVVTLILITVHAIYEFTKKNAHKPSSNGPRIERHKKIDRIFHWIMAITIFALLITGIFPIVGLNFAWLELHWIAGIILTILIIWHILRSFTQDFRSMVLNSQDIKEALNKNLKSGKYTPAQKSMHMIVSILTLLVIGSGIIMFLQIDTPWWGRTNALSETTLGIIFFIHGISTLALIGVICLHIYFGLRPEKLFYTRSMIKGWISKEEMHTQHDPQRWKADESS